MTEPTRSAEAAEPPELRAAWGVFWLRAQDLGHVVEGLNKHSGAFLTFAECAYSANEEMIPTPEAEASDITMLRRLLEHLEGWIAEVPGAVSKVRKAVGEIEAAR